MAVQSSIVILTTDERAKVLHANCFAKRIPTHDDIIADQVLGLQFERVTHIVHYRHDMLSMSHGTRNCGMKKPAPDVRRSSGSRKNSSVLLMHAHANKFDAMLKLIARTYDRHHGWFDILLSLVKHNLK